MMNSDKNIIIVTSEFPPQPGGIGNHAYNLALYLSKQNISVEVIADQRSKIGNAEAIFDQGLPFSVVRIKRYNFRFIMYLKRIAVTYKSFKRATAIIATGKFSLWNVAFCKLFHKRQTLAIIHGTEVNFKSAVLKKTVDIAIKRFDNIIAVSRYTKNLMSHLGAEVKVIPNGIDLSYWTDEITNTINLKGNPILTTVGRVSSRKGQLNVIKHLPELIRYYPEIHYHCIGIPSEADDFLKIADQLEVSSYITFHGSLEVLKMKQILNKTDIFVMLSSESKSGDVEGFGIAILEANALGVPAIGSRGCGIEDAIDPNVSGILIDLDDVKGFKNGIDSILGTKVLFKSESKNWAKKHDWSLIVNQYLALLK